MSEQDNQINTEPVKSFFVSMLTRDIQLEDAILDLLDNCIDGILRSSDPSKRDKEKPYKDYWAKIEFSADEFKIQDNCGGIPKEVREYAFRMGRPKNRPDENNGTVGVYGIGMKRAIFKIGQHCTIETKSKDSAYKVEITPQWIENEEDWNLPIKSSDKQDEGTTITLKTLNTGTAKLFEEKDEKDTFIWRLQKKIAEQYAIIIDKGFEIFINEKIVVPAPTKIIFAENDEKAIRPFIFQAKIEDVDVFLTVGFTQPIPSDNEVLNEQEELRYSSQNAGWTIICNDRVVLYCDRTELTGWGEAGVPRYHTQFIAIAGIVEFKSDNAAKLPTTTTKRGIDASSILYLQIKNKMREGMKKFTDWTNKWKINTDESKQYFKKESAIPLSLNEIKNKVKNNNKVSFNNTQSPAGKQYIPELPVPKSPEQLKNMRRINFTVEEKKIKPVIEYLEMEQNSEPSDVGKKCFDFVYQEAIS
jgi:hypothetical protein